MTGAGGFLGSHILQQALDGTDWEIVCVDSFRHNGGTDRIMEAIYPSENRERHRRVRVLTHDLNARLNARQVADIGRADLMVHTAARCSVDDSFRDPHGHVLNNVQTTLSALDLADVLNVDRYIHVSTDEVFGHTWGTSGMTNDTHRPSSPYAASKAAQEDITRAWRQSFGLPATIVNSANLFGERQSLLAFIPRVIKRILNGDKVTIHTTDSGHPAWRHYTYAPNLAAWIVEDLMASSAPERILLNGQAGINVLKLAETIAAILGKDLDYTLAPGRDYRPAFDASYAKMGGHAWEPEVPFTEALERTVTWYRGNPAWLEHDG